MPLIAAVQKRFKKSFVKGISWKWYSRSLKNTMILVFSKILGSWAYYFTKYEDLHIFYHSSTKTYIEHLQLLFLQLISRFKNRCWVVFCKVTFCKKLVGIIPILSLYYSILLKDEHKMFYLFLPIYWTAFLRTPRIGWLWNLRML